jgi:hypothetical protein
MASIIREVVVEASADDVWKVVGDFATGPSRMAPGFVVDTVVQGDRRVVTFGNGSVAVERFVSLDDDLRRLAYSVVGGTVQPEHDNAVMQILHDGERRCRFVWTRDVLPEELAEPIGQAMSRGLDVIEQTFGNALG